MSHQAYVKELTFKTIGKVEGSNTQTGRVGWIPVLSMSHEIVSPKDPATGASTGKRQHKAITLNLEICKATPLIHSGLVNNETITKCEIVFFSSRQAGQRGSNTGTEFLIYTILLENANVAGMLTRHPHAKNPELASYDTYTEVSLTYQKITWTWADGGITADDDWETPKA